jgi:hypothetical protein
MPADARFYAQFAAAKDVVRLRREAGVFEEVCAIARWRGDGDLLALAERYRDEAMSRAAADAAGGPSRPPIPDAVLELARVAGRHPTGWSAAAMVGRAG